MNINRAQETDMWEDRIQEELEKYVLFDLERETYCLPILKIQEIIADHELTLLPNLPDFYHGVMSLRGAAIPVVNLRRRFGLPDRDKSPSTRVIILDLQPSPIGIRVDSVRRVASVARSAFEHPPTLSGGRQHCFQR